MATQLFDTVASAFAKAQRWNKSSEAPAQASARVYELHRTQKATPDRQERPANPAPVGLSAVRPNVLPPVGLVPGQTLVDDPILREALDRDWRKLGAQIAREGLGRDGLERDLAQYRASFVVALRTMRQKRVAAISALKHQIQVEGTESPHACKGMGHRVALLEVENTEIDEQISLANGNDGPAKGGWFASVELTLRNGFKAAEVVREQSAKFFSED